MLLPSVVAMTIDAYVSLGRIQDYLLAEEEAESRNIDESLKDAFTMTDASFTWEIGGKSQEDEEQREYLKKDLESGMKTTENITGKPSPERGDGIPFHFDRINLTFNRKELVAIVGSVASGKSSFLAALAGDMRLTSGIVTQSSAIAYCPQYAWIQNASIKDNIIFGRNFDKERYQQVIESCALQVDLEMLPHGDMTEVGERGITVSAATFVPTVPNM